MKDGRLQRIMEENGKRRCIRQQNDHRSDITQLKAQFPSQHPQKRGKSPRRLMPSATVMLCACRGSIQCVLLNPVDRQALQATDELMKKKFDPSVFAIPNLTVGLILLIAIVNGLDLWMPGNLPHFSFEKLFTTEWWTVLLFPFRIAQTWLSLVVYLYMFFMIGQNLEAAIGDLRYSLYIFTGIVFAILGSYFSPVSAVFIYLSVFLAVAHLDPERQLLLFFIIPMKYRWLAIGVAVYLLFIPARNTISTGSASHLLGPVLGFANYIIFFAIPYLLHVGGVSRTASFKRKARRTDAIHRCTVCGMTEADDPTMDFRFCVDCDDHEYCSKHLHAHEHIRSA